MSRWKDAGIVQDSDDEEGLDESFTTLLSPSRPPSQDTELDEEQGVENRPGSPKSSLELDRPQELQTSIDGRHDHDEAHHSDSELSDVPDDFGDHSPSPGDELPSVQVLIEQRRKPVEQRVLPQVASHAFRLPSSLFDDDNVQLPIAVEPQPEPQHQTEPVDLTRLLSEPPRRHLRKRNDIQLHPYLLEQQQYLKQCLARGVKPVRVRLEDIRAAPGQQSAETQEQEETLSQSTQSSQGLWALESSASESQERHQQPATSSSQPDAVPPQASDDELPDVSELIRPRSSHQTQPGNKRRKMDHVYKSGRHNLQHMLGGVRDSSYVESADVFSVPPSPLSRGASSNLQTNRVEHIGFKMPRRLTPALPTPSTTNRTAAHRLPDSDDSDESPKLPSRSTGQRRGFQHPAPESSASEAGSDDSDMSEASEIFRVQRRIKGVLPASWLRLDLQAQTKRRMPLTSPPPDKIVARPEKGKGVAQRVIRPQTDVSSTRPSTTIDLDPSDDSDASLNERHMPSSPPRRITPVDRYQQHLYESLFLDDIEEDNAVDAMLPAQSRGPRQAVQISSRSPKQQTKLIDTFGAAKCDRHATGRSGHSAQGSRVPRMGSSRKVTKTRSRQPRFRPPRLGILDAEESDDTIHKAPQFVRLAKRAARRQQDLGRASPDRKLIRLQNSEDTNDAHHILRRWRQGTIQPRKITRPQLQVPSARSPLTGVSHNRRSGLSRPVQSHGVAGFTSNTLDGSKSTVRPPQTLSTAKRLQQSRISDKVMTQGLPPAAFDVVSRPGDNVLNPEARIKTRRRVLTKHTTMHNAQLEAPQASTGDIDEGFTLGRFLQRMQARPRPSLASYNAAPSLNTTSHNLQGQDQPAQKLEVTAKIPQPRQQDRRPLIRRHRKRPGRQIDLGAQDLEQVFQTILPQSASREECVLDEASPHTRQGLEGLPTFGTPLPIDFDVKRLSIGTSLHPHTFVGSGEFDACLRFFKRDLNVPGSPCNSLALSRDLGWSAWSDSVAADLRTVLNQICLLAEMPVNSCVIDDASEAVSLLRNVVAYVATTLYFKDPTDQSAMVSCLSEQVQVLRNNLTDHVASKYFGASMHVLLLALEGMLWHMADQCRSQEVGLIERLIAKSSQFALALWKEHSKDPVSVKQRLQRIERQAGGLGNERIVEGIVVTHHLLAALNIAGLDIWSLFNEEWLPLARGTFHVSTLEDVWRSSSSLKPLLHLDSRGLVDHRSPAVTNWPLLKTLTARTLYLYQETTGQTASLNTYIRILLARCYHALCYWKWECPESVLNAWFDFFAARKLAGLRLEDSSASLRSLEYLHAEPDLELASNDSTFQMFLKLLAKGLFSVRSAYPDRKVAGIVQRFVPNHGRTYPKDSSLTQADLDALRNHHDLLSVLYWASPAGHRPGLHLLRNLVDHSDSHREACRLNVRAWSNLARYQASIDEPVESLQPFTAWMRDILTRTVAQYRAARTEAEAQQATMTAQGDKQWAFELVTKVVDNNQRQVLATLAEAISGIRSAVAVAASEGAVTALLRESGVPTILTAFDGVNPRAGSVVIAVLEVYQQHVDRLDVLQTQRHPMAANNESQEYGDWPDLDTLDELEADATGSGRVIDASSPLSLAADDLQRYLLQVFASNLAPGDATEKALQVVVNIAHARVGRNETDWSAYIDPFASHSWDKLSYNKHSRAFGHLYFALIVEKDPQNVFGTGSALGQHEEAILTLWLTGLTDCEPSKYHERLTKALLNTRQWHTLPLLRMSGISSTVQNGTRGIPSMVLRESLLASILANMRTHVAQEHRFTRSLRPLYLQKLMKLMAAMKKNYLEVAHTDAASDYVAFLQGVVALLTQYTTDICPVDKFFTDGVHFPASEEDPSYIAAKLKSYEPKLSEVATQKAFAAFLHGLLVQAVRHAVHDQRSPMAPGTRIDEDSLALFVGRFYAAVSARCTNGPSLLATVVGGMLPIYLEHCFTEGIGFVVVQLLLQTLARVFPDALRQASGGSNQRKIEVTNSLIYDLLDAAVRVTVSLVEGAHRLDVPNATRTLARLVDAVEATLSMIRYFVRLRRLSSTAWDLVLLFERAVGSLASQDGTDQTLLASSLSERSGRPVEEFGDLRAYMNRNVKLWLGGMQQSQMSHVDQERVELREASGRIKATVARLSANKNNVQRRQGGIGRVLMRS